MKSRFKIPSTCLQPMSHSKPLKTLHFPVKPQAVVFYPNSGSDSITGISHCRSSGLWWRKFGVSPISSHLLFLAPQISGSIIVHPSFHRMRLSVPRIARGFGVIDFTLVFDSESTSTFNSKGNVRSNRSKSMFLITETEPFSFLG